MTDHEYFNGSEWKLGNRLTTDHVWDAFIIYSLLEDSEQQGTLLEVTHEGKQGDRFKEAMETRNKRIVLYGQPNAVCHACDKCMRIFEMEDGSFSAFKFKLAP